MSFRVDPEQDEDEDEFEDDHGDFGEEPGRVRLNSDECKGWGMRTLRMSKAMAQENHTSVALL